MIEIRTYDGEPAELAAFCTGVWRDRYRDKMPTGLWGGPFMDWEYFADQPGARDFLVAAYDGGRLVGALPAKPVQFQLRGEPVAGSFGSFFAVDPVFEKQGVSIKLLLEQRRRHRERDVSLFAGWLIRGSSAALGQQFWLRLPNLQVVAKLALWARIIDHRAMRDFVFDPFERRGLRVLSWFQGRPIPPADSTGIRPYREADLDDCLRLAGRLSRAAEFGLVWDRTTLARQLSFKDFPRTLVAEHGGRVAGFVNYYLWPTLARREMLAAVIDLIAVDELPSRLGKKLLKTALAQMAADGCHTALCMHNAGQPHFLMLRLGFVPEFPSYDYVLQSMRPDAPLVKTRRLHALWR